MKKFTRENLTYAAIAISYFTLGLLKAVHLLSYI
jgi:hypothetical protein